MGDSENPGALPISWDEAREVVTVVLLAAAALYSLSPLVQFLDNHLPGAMSDHLLTITRNVGPAAGLFALGAGVLIATTPATDVVPALRTAALVICNVLVAAGIVAIVLTLTQASANGVLPRLATVFGRSGPGTMLCATAAWLVRRVEPFPG